MIANKNKKAFPGLLIAAIIVIIAGTAEAATRTEVKRMIIEEALNSRVPPALALAVAKVESDFQDHTLSTAGARGVMQIMPQTAREEFGVDQDELWNARLNVQLGIDYLERLHNLYGEKWSLALSHYNGGSLKGGSGSNARPHVYTRKYVADVLKWRARYAEQAQVWQVATNKHNGDGWTPARTKVGLVANASDTVERTFGSLGTSRIVVREISDNAALFHASTKASFVQEDLNFMERLRRARLSLDDFVPIVRWWEG